MLKKNDPSAPNGDWTTYSMLALLPTSNATQLKKPLPAESNAGPGSLAAAYVWPAPGAPLMVSVFGSVPFARSGVASAAAEGARVDAETRSSEIVRRVGVRGLLAVVGGTKRQRLYGSDQCAAGNEWRCLDAGQTRQLHWLQLASGGIANDAVGCSLPESRSWVGAKHCDRQTARECRYDSGKGRHEQLLLLFH